MTPRNILSPRRGFTLIELMVSIAILVVLMVGVAQVFQYTSQAVGANQQMSDAVRNDRAIQSTLSQDFQQIAVDTPMLLIRNQVQQAFRNRADLAKDTDGNPGTWDPIGVGTETLQYPAIINERTHRVDVMSFMARGKFHRQTGDDGVFIEAQDSTEALIWLGHLGLPHTNGSFYLGGASTGTLGTKTYPGYGTQATNPQNYFSTQWTLGHVTTLLKLPVYTPGASSPNYGTIALGTGTINFVARDRALDAGTTDVAKDDLSPLRYASPVTDPNYSYQAQDSRYDIAGTSVADFTQLIKRAMGVPWEPGLSFAVGDRTYAGGYTYVCSQANTATAANKPGTSGGSGFWNYQVANSDWFSNLMMVGRYQSNPFVVKPVDAKNYSQQMPIFAQGCSHFVVEYAGDFLRQDNNPSSPTYGYVFDSIDNPDAPAAGYAHTDGETDFIVTWDDANTNGKIDPAELSTVHREIRWYGLPRNVSDVNEPLGTVKGYDVSVTSGLGMTKPQDLIDVVPFRDVAMTIQTTVANATALGIATTSFPANALGPTFHYSKPVAGYFGGPWEKFSTLSTNVGVPSLRVLPRYADPTDVNNTNGMQPTEFYQCAWGPYEMNMRPTMIRITVTLDDPNSRLAEGQTFQYVFKLP